MVTKVLFWRGFGAYSLLPYTLRARVYHRLVSQFVSAKANQRESGLAVRAWQLGLEMRPFFNKESLWAYPVFAGAGASFWILAAEEWTIDNKNLGSEEEEHTREEGEEG